MTEHQKKFQDHLINRTLEGYLTENVSLGNYLTYINILNIIGPSAIISLV